MNVEPDTEPASGCDFPETTWSEHGIDALTWADGEPYADVLSPCESSAEVLEDEQETWLGRS
jgi:hypothetical protein